MHMQAKHFTQRYRDGSSATVSTAAHYTSEWALPVQAQKILYTPAELSLVLVLAHHSRLHDHEALGAVNMLPRQLQTLHASLLLAQPPEAQQLKAARTRTRRRSMAVAASAAPSAAELALGAQAKDLSAWPLEQALTLSQPPSDLRQALSVRSQGMSGNADATQEYAGLVSQSRARSVTFGGEAEPPAAKSPLRADGPAPAPVAPGQHARRFVVIWQAVCTTYLA